MGTFEDRPASPRDLKAPGGIGESLPLRRPAHEVELGNLTEGRSVASFDPMAACTTSVLEAASFTAGPGASAFHPRVPGGVTLEGLHLRSQKNVFIQDQELLTSVLAFQPQTTLLDH